MPQQRPIGIDLGTTNSAMAWVDPTGRSAMLLNAEGELITPSVVYFSDSEVIVGKNARSAITAHPEMVAQWVKRDMGAPFHSHPIRGHYLPPEVIQACILRKLKADITRILGEDTRAVITVPAYFDEPRRKATADAGEMAGIRVLDIVNEPTAAALAFGEALGYLRWASGDAGPGTSGDAYPTREEMNVMVYDLGGGTFDATLLHLATGNVQTLATDGDVQLGGHDWDQRLVDYAAESFRKSHGRDPREDPATLNRLYQDAMEAKHTLSARSRATIRVDFDGRSCEVQVAREQFEEMTADLLERTAYTSRQLLAAARLEWKDVRKVLLVGGSTRMPMVPRMLKAMTGIEPDRTVNPDEAVARGAAIYAGYLLAKHEGGTRPAFQVGNVNAHSLGIEGIDPETLRKKNVILIPRNTPLPAKYTERFSTKSEGQRSIVIRVLEGESSLPGECIAIGRTVVRDLPTGLPKGWPIEVAFEYATNGLLTVEALVPGTEHRARLELEREVGLSGEGIARWKQPIAAAAGFGAFESVSDLPVAPSPTMPLAASPTMPLAASQVEGRRARGEGRGGKGDGVAAPPAAGSQPAPATAIVSAPLPLGGIPAATATEMSLPASTPPSTPAPAPSRTKREPLIPLWASRTIGHIVASLLGLLLAYYPLSYFRSDVFPPIWPLWTDAALVAKTIDEAATAMAANDLERILPYISDSPEAASTRDRARIILDAIQIVHVNVSNMDVKVNRRTNPPTATATFDVLVAARERKIESGERNRSGKLTLDLRFESDRWMVVGYKVKEQIDPVP